MLDSIDNYHRFLKTKKTIEHKCLEVMRGKTEIKAFVKIAALLVIGDLKLVPLHRANRGITNEANSIFCLPFFVNVCKEISSHWFHKVIDKYCDSPSRC